MVANAVVADDCVGTGISGLRPAGASRTPRTGRRCPGRLRPVRRATPCWLRPTRAWPGRSGRPRPVWCPAAGGPRRCRLAAGRRGAGRAIPVRPSTARRGPRTARATGCRRCVSGRTRRTRLDRPVAVGTLARRRPTVPRGAASALRLVRRWTATRRRPASASRSRRAAARPPAAAIAGRTTSQRGGWRWAPPRRPPDLGVAGDQRHDPGQHHGAQNDHREQRRDHVRADDQHDRHRDADAEQLRQRHRLGLDLRLLRAVGALGLRGCRLREQLRRVGRLRLGLVRLRGLGHHTAPSMYGWAHR